MQLGDATRETPMDCLAKNRLSRGSAFLQHPLQRPHISHHGSSDRRSVANRIFFPPVLLLSGSLQHTVKPFITKEGKGFTTIFKKQAQAAEETSSSIHSFGQLLGNRTRAWQNPRGWQHPPPPPAHRASILPKSQLLSLSPHTTEPRHVKEQLVSQAAKAAATKAE